MKIRNQWLWIGMILLILTSCSKDGAGVRVIKVGLTHSKSHVFTEALERFAAALEQETDGRFRVKIFHSSQVGSEKEMQEMLTIGSLEMSLTGILNQYQPLFSVFEMPYLYRDRDHVIRVNTSPLMDQVAEPLQHQGLRVLGFYENGFRNITNSIRPIQTPDDLQGMMIRTPENLAQIETMRAFGAIPTPMSFSELYTALVQGVVDGQENPLPNIWFGRLHEVQPYLAMTRHIYNSVYVLISLDFWDSLHPDDQAIFQRCMLQSSRWQMAKMEALEKEIETRMQTLGIQFTYPNQAVFANAVQPAYDVLYERYGDPARQLVEGIRALEKDL